MVSLMNQLVITDCMHDRLVPTGARAVWMAMRALKQGEIELLRELGLRRLYLPSLTEEESREFFSEFDRSWGELVRPFGKDHPFWRNVVSSKMQEWERSAGYLALALFTLARRGLPAGTDAAIVLCSSLAEEDLCVDWAARAGWDVQRRARSRLPLCVRRVCEAGINAARGILMLCACLYKKLYAGGPPGASASTDTPVLMTSLFYPDSFREGAYHDPFFGMLHERIEETGGAVTYLCEPLNDYRQGMTRAGQCSSPRIVTPYSVLSWCELVCSAVRVLTRRFRVPRMEFMGCDFSRVVRWNAVRWNESYNSTAELFYAAARKLARSNGFTRLVQLYEGNVFERACIQAFREAADGPVVGYSQAVVFSLNLKIRLVPGEADTRPEPDYLVCTGPRNADRMVRMGRRPKGSVRAGCSLRYIPKSDELPAGGGSRETVLVALDGMRQTAAMVDWLIGHREVFGDRKVVVRAHPNVPLDWLLTQCCRPDLPGNFSKSAGSLADDLAGALCVVYRMSSVGMQGLLSGIPAIHLAVDVPLEADPISDLTALKWTAHSAEELAGALAEIRELEPEARAARIPEAKSYALSYFSEPTRERLAPFWGTEESNEQD